MKCLKCGEYEASYCEECHQRLIAENLKLQVRVKELEKQLNYEHKPKHMKDENLEENLFLKQFRGHIPEIDYNIKEGEE